jgi:hypothetical protein
MSQVILSTNWVPELINTKSANPLYPDKTGIKFMAITEFGYEVPRMNGKTTGFDAPSRNSKLDTADGLITVTPLMVF